MNLGTDLVTGAGHTSGAATSLIVQFDPANMIAASPTPAPDLTVVEVFGVSLATRTATANATRSIRGRALMQLQSGVWVLIAGELIGSSIGSAALLLVSTAIVNVPNGGVPARPSVGINATGVAGLEIDWGITLQVTLFSP